MILNYIQYSIQLNEILYSMILKVRWDIHFFGMTPIGRPRNITVLIKHGKVPMFPGIQNMPRDLDSISQEILFNIQYIL
jgi:hypothetical protein